VARAEGDAQAENSQDPLNDLAVMEDDSKFTSVSACYLMTL
jgi:hypothetical protein